MEIVCFNLPTLEIYCSGLGSALANKGRIKVTFEPGDWVWVHMRMERFPNQRKSKLNPRENGPLQILEKINDNAYKLVLSEYGNINDTLKMNPFEEGGNDRDAIGPSANL